MDEQLLRSDLIWRQNSRELWTKDGDRNSKFFHLSTIIQQHTNFIAANKDNEGHWHQDEEEIGNYFLRNFIDLFKTTDPSFPKNLEGQIPPMINEEDNASLIPIPSPEEINKALNSIRSLKAPRLDDMPALFYKFYGEIVKPLLISSVQKFF